MGLPIANKNSCSDGTENYAYEIDLSSKKLLKKKLGINKFDCYPFLFVVSTPS